MPRIFFSFLSSSLVGNTYARIPAESEKEREIGRGEGMKLYVITRKLLGAFDEMRRYFPREFRARIERTRRRRRKKMVL